MAAWMRQWKYFKSALNNTFQIGTIVLIVRTYHKFEWLASYKRPNVSIIVLVISGEFHQWVFGTASITVCTIQHG